MQALEIQDVARRMLEAHGVQAIAKAAQEARSYAAQGNDERAEEWRRIEAALLMMRGPKQS